MLKQSSFDLNGPYLSFIEQPVGVTTTNGGTVTLVGIATASFKTGVSTDSPDAPDNPAVGSGSLTYQWYEVGVDGAADKVVVDDVDINGVISGAGTTALTIAQAISPQDDGKEYYVVADYTPSTTTGNAPNEPISSEIAIVTVKSILEITSQPTNQQSAASSNESESEFYVGARVSGGNIGDDITYQWYIDESSNVYNIKTLYRFYDQTSYDHYCSDNENPASGYYSQGELCSLFTEQAPGTIGIIDAEADSRGVDRPDTGLVGYGYPNLAAAQDADNLNVIPIYKMVRDDITTIDEMWSISPFEGENPTTATITITGDDGSTKVIKSSQVSSYSDFETNVTYTIVSDAQATVLLTAVGGEGGSSIERSVDGGSGGSTSGTFTFLKDQEYILRVGGAGHRGGPGGYSGGGDGGGGHGKGGGGGGFTGLFLKSSTSVLDVWTTTPGISGYGSWYGVAYGDGKFVAVGVNGVMYSTDDGIT